MGEKVKVTNSEKEVVENKRFWQSKSPEYRLDAVELLRIEAGKFLYEYPTRLQSIVKVTRKIQR